MILICFFVSILQAKLSILISILYFIHSLLNSLQEADHYNNVEVISVTSEQLKALTNGEEDPIIEIFISSSLLASDQVFPLFILYVIGIFTCYHG